MRKVSWNEACKQASEGHNYPCSTCGFVSRASDCGIHERWKNGVFGETKGSGCMALDLYRRHLYQKKYGGGKKK